MTVLPQFAGSNVTEDGNVIKLTKCFTPGLAVQCTIGDVIGKGQYYGTLTGNPMQLLYFWGIWKNFFEEPRALLV